MKVVEEIVKDRRKLLPFLNAKFEVDSEIYEVARLKGAVFDVTIVTNLGLP